MEQAVTYLPSLQTTVAILAADALGMTGIRSERIEPEAGRSSVLVMPRHRPCGRRDGRQAVPEFAVALQGVGKEQL